MDHVWSLQDEKAAREAAEARVAQLQAELAEAKVAAQTQVGDGERGLMHTLAERS
jgi:hypothetical protein